MAIIGTIVIIAIIIVIIVITFTLFKLIIDGMRMPPPLPQGHIKEITKGKLNMANPDHKLTNNLFASLLPL